MEFQDLSIQNPWWNDPNTILNDSKIMDIDKSNVKWTPRMKKYLHLNNDVVYSLRGPRQVGKTTLCKIIVKEELQKRKTCDIFYFTCDLVSSNNELKEIIELYLKWSYTQSKEKKLIILDEISRIKNWELAIKYINDVYSINGKTYILTGSSSWDLKHNIERLPGRKGELHGEQNHKILLPMKFSEYVEIMDPNINNKLIEMNLKNNDTRIKAFNEIISNGSDKWINPLLPYQEKLNLLLDEYLIHGGIMNAVNQYKDNNRIENSVYEMYLQYLIGDMIGMGKDEIITKKILTSVINHKGKLVGWEDISKQMSLSSTITITEYLEKLSALFVLNIYYAFDQNLKQPKYKGKKKLQIPNPFFFHAIKNYVENPGANYYANTINFVMSENKSLLIESLCGDHLSRMSYNHAPTDLYNQSESVFYVKNSKGETIDFIVKLKGELIPVEVKYQNQIKKSDYNNIRKFKQGIIVSKNTYEHYENYVSIPVSIFLMFI